MDNIFYRFDEQENCRLFYRDSGEVVTRLYIGSDVYPVGSNLTTCYEHPAGIVLDAADIRRLQIPDEKGSIPALELHERMAKLHPGDKVEAWFISRGRLLGYVVKLSKVRSDVLVNFAEIGEKWVSAASVSHERPVLSREFRVLQVASSAYLSEQLPDNWESMDLGQQKMFLIKHAHSMQDGASEILADIQAHAKRISRLIPYLKATGDA